MQLSEIESAIFDIIKESLKDAPMRVYLNKHRKKIIIDSTFTLHVCDIWLDPNHIRLDLSRLTSISKTYHIDENIDANIKLLINYIKGIYITNIYGTSRRNYNIFKNEMLITDTIKDFNGKTFKAYFRINKNFTVVVDGDAIYNQVFGDDVFDILEFMASKGFAQIGPVREITRKEHKKSRRTKDT